MLKGEQYEFDESIKQAGFLKKKRSRVNQLFAE